ncbi:MAG: AraC family transcriptional regulator [Spirochaetia bacterium]|nr:AraC family transcriptional regulator [Spirochaetia bacterium]
MKPIKLMSSSFVDFPGRGYASYIFDKQQLKVFHNHDFYEIFLVDQGNASHMVNGLKLPLCAGSLCFVRPDDSHCYQEVSDDFRIINIIIPEKIITALFLFLGSSFDGRRLLESSAPPCVCLDYQDLSSLIRDFEQLILYKKILREKSDTMYRITIFNLITRFFMIQQVNTQTSPIPQWLKLLSLQMLTKENFTKGLPAMYRLSGKSPEHVSRACKKHLGKTPSQLVNDIRLEHSAMLLVTTNTPVIDICHECGFESLSYFYHRFKEHYTISPVGFRKDKNNTESKIYLMGNLSVKAEIPAAIPIRT